MLHPQHVSGIVSVRARYQQMYARTYTLSEEIRFREGKPKNHTKLFFNFNLPFSFNII